MSVTVTCCDECYSDLLMSVAVTCFDEWYSDRCCCDDECYSECCCHECYTSHGSTFHPSWTKVG